MPVARSVHSRFPSGTLFFALLNVVSEYTLEPLRPGHRVGLGYSTHTDGWADLPHLLERS